MPVTSWSTSPSSNNSAPPNGWPEGMAAAAVNDTARQMMADLVREFQVNAVKVLASVAGTNTITGTMSPDLTSYSAGMVVIFTPANSNTGATTLNIDSLGALDIQKYNGDALIAGDLAAGVPALMVLDSGADDWILLNPQGWIVDSPNASASESGFKGLPQGNAGAGNYTAVLSDAGKHLLINGGNTLTIPANSSVAYPAGTVLTIVNVSGASSATIAITSDTLRLAGTASTGSRTLAPLGMASALKIGSTEWFISGTGLS